ncbi:MAG: hypothetical protein LPK04_05055 [Caulobacteraceae bacterium]|nr:hypothetical protein [Caulobacteraceae bacterium]
MERKTVFEEYYVVGAGPGPGFLDQAGGMTMKAHLARPFVWEADAEDALAAVADTPAFRGLDLRIIKVRSETVLEPRP